MAPKAGEIPQWYFDSSLFVALIILNNHYSVETKIPSPIIKPEINDNIVFS